MNVSVENLSTLERRVSVSLPITQIETEVDERLKKLARTVKLHGFRPGKVPFKLVAQQYGPQVRQEVVGDTVQKSFGEAVRERNLRVAGMPKFEARDEAPSPQEFAYSATFEVYPELALGDLSQAKIERPVVEVTAADIERTIEILRQQRATYETTARAVEATDQVVIDFLGTIDAVPFAGGAGQDAEFVLGKKRLLPEFEAALLGMHAGESKTFTVQFPADYGGVEVAGKTASFEVTVKRVAAPKIPALDAEFARQMGVADGDLTRMRSEVEANVRREVDRRVKARIKDRVIDVLLQTTPVEVPKALIAEETERLKDMARRDMEARGMPVGNAPIPSEMFEAQAGRRVSLGLIFAEAVKKHGLHAKPAQVKAEIQALAESYERPEEVVKWYYGSSQRLSEVEAIVVESNVVEWVLGAALVTDTPLAFDTLMGSDAAVAASA
ncbi:MAG: trigger factor [Proteobacteria bacterium]|nr:trigger factor [Burkholderiales bacterium]